nr:hypothetical protein [Nitrospinota bacterium]
MQTFYKKIINWNIKLREINSSVAIIFLSAFMLGAAPFTLKSIDETYYNANTIEDFLRTETLILDSLNSSPNRTDLLWRLARNQFRIAKRTTDERQKLSLFENCLNTAKKGISIDKNSAENIYYMGLCLGNISLLKGILSSLSHREVLKSSMERAVEINPNVENAGPHRFLGVYFNVLPLCFGGDSAKAICQLKP